MVWLEGMENDFGHATISLIPSIALQGLSRATVIFIVSTTHCEKYKAQTAIAIVQSAVGKYVFPCLFF
jgi:hypothetical protein